MAKLFYKKIEQCRDCPQFFGGQSPHCVFNNEKVDPNTIPGHCHLVDYQEKIEANETKRVWILKSKYTTAEYGEIIF